MATQITYTWTPAGGNSLSQGVEYKRDIDPNFLVAVTGLGPQINTYAINGSFDDNRVYEGRIKNVCSSGGDFYTPVMRAIKFTCPAANVTATAKVITVAFPHLGGSIDQYRIKLFDATGTNLLDNRVVNGNIPGSISEEFTGSFIAPGTAYKVRVEVYAGPLSKLDCDFILVNTPAPVVCATPVITNATVS